MKSIRLSLIVYFLVLLTAALAGVSWFSYQSTEDALDQKLDSTTRLLKTQHEEDRKREIVEFDRKLLERGRDLAKRLESREAGEFHGYWVNHTYEARFHSAVQCPLAIVHAAIARGLRRARLSDYIVHRPDEMEMPLWDEHDFVQICNYLGRPMDRSENLESWLPAIDNVRIKWSGKFFPRLHENPPRFDYVTITRQGKTIAARRVGFGAILPGRLVQGFGLPRGRPSATFEQRTVPVLFHFASDTKSLDAALAGLKASLDRDLAALATAQENHLADLRTRMLWIGIAAFVALVIGGLTLVHLGLGPLNRLTDAVHKISVRDFRLGVNPATLPRELKPIATRLEETLEQLKRAFEREKQAAADISHELRTPLATLLTNIDVGLNKLRTPEQYREILEDCRASGQHMNMLVERLLTLARLDAGAAPVRPCPVDVNSLAHQCAELVRPLARVRNLDLRVHTAGPAVLQADPDKLREVLNNLLSNAIEYNKPNGSIDVSVGRENGHLTLVVRDTGIGIPAEARTRIFERFFRADPSRACEGVHAGLGLSIVKGYVDLMGGSIGVDSDDSGSTFRVELPVKA